MSVVKRINYYRRILAAYGTSGKSQLTFWHERPEVNPNFVAGQLGEYYMTFRDKADYAGSFDSRGIPQLDYRGVLGLQHNPIAIAQYGLANFNQYQWTGDATRRERFLRVADWLVESLEPNSHGLMMWMHHFDWEYRDTLRSPWYSGLAQGQGISVLVRAHRETGAVKYMDAAKQALAGFYVDVKDGGVAYTDEDGNLWFEEYIVSPPTHILNGFMWGSWGVYDYFLATGDKSAGELFQRVVQTIAANLPQFDTGFWSLYEQSGTVLPMIASSFYHRLHIVQLLVFHKMTGMSVFREFAERWEGYRDNTWNAKRALIMKAAFKLCYY